MSETLYLDTARLGLISPSAQRLQIQFARLASDPHGLLYFREFLSTGAERRLPASQRVLAAFQGWRGIHGLHDSIRHLVNAPKRAEVLLASRSATVMHVAAQQIAKQCDRVLTVDLLWPPYRRILVNSFRCTRKSVHVCQLRNAAIHCGADHKALAESICKSFRKQNCDGLLLPLVDHRGVTLPVAEIVRTLRAEGHSLKRVVVDVSQALGHIPVDLESINCDMLIGGSHKWLGSYQPLGIGVSNQPLEVNYSRLANLDPLMRLIQEQVGTCRARHGETAAVLPLLTAAGALVDKSPFAINQQLEVRQANRRTFTKLLEESDWRPLRASEEDHGILLSRLPRNKKLYDCNALRDYFVEHGIAATTYSNGLVRFSMPHLYFSEHDLHVLQSALSFVPINILRALPAKERRLSSPMVVSTTAPSAASTKQAMV